MNIKMTEFGHTCASVLYEDIDCNLIYTVYFSGNYNKKLFSFKVD